MQKINQSFQKLVMNSIKPARTSLILGTLNDVTRSNLQLIAENALLRQQLIVINRQVKKPKFTSLDRLLLVGLASTVQSWKQALLIVKPDTLLRWHRQGFKLFWRFKSKAKKAKPKISEETIALIQQMAHENPLWGAERIRGELLKLSITVSKRTVRKYLRKTRPGRTPTQNWSTFLCNHSKQIWACDFLTVTDLFFSQIYAFIIMEHASRRIVHFDVTRHPTDEWVAQQLREATPNDQKPKYLIRDNDRKFGPAFERVAATRGIEVLKTPIAAPKANALCERLMGTLRRECLDHLFILGETHLKRILKEYVKYYNQQRPHQGIEQKLPEPKLDRPISTGKILAFPVLGGLHHSYERAS
ncbi:MAG TPA: integrase core domain-containing protein [Chloroflexia bacterium]|nr:integrase core domain-containing protein [Chloroflexia bacterium]